MINIDKKIPQPVSKTRPYKYPWPTLKVGDSFFIPQYNHSVHNMVIRYNQSRPKKDHIKIRTAKENGGVRIWRIK